MSPSEYVDHWLTELSSLGAPAPGGCPWVLHFPARHPRRASMGMPEVGSSSSGRTLHAVLGFCIHGNEFGTLEAAHRLGVELGQEALGRELDVSLLIGNPEAARKNVRFIEEDLNRVFTFEQTAHSLERKRAEEIRSVLDSADFFLDFHQTQTPTEEAFWTLPWEQDLGLVARGIGGAKVGLTRAPGGAFSAGRRCADEYVRDRGKWGLTLEVGTRGADPRQVELTYGAAKRALALVSQVLGQGENLLDLAHENLLALAHESPPIAWYQTAHIFTDQSRPFRLRPGLTNFNQVEKGEILSPEGEPLIRAEHSGHVLFPKYPGEGEPQPPELFRLGVAVEDPDSEFA